MLLLDVSRLVWRRWSGRLPTGIDRVCLAYLDHFAEESQAVVQRGGRQLVLDRARSAALFAQLAGEGPLDRPRLGALLAGAALRGSAPVAEGALYINVGHTGLDQPGLGGWIARHKLRPVYFIHDLIPLTHPHLCRAGEAKKHARRMGLVLETAAGVVANSADTLGELARFAKSQARPAPPAIAAPLGLDVARRPLKAEAGGDPYFVVLGTIEARKNHLFLLQSWEQMAAQSGADAVPQLRVIGQRGWESGQAIAFLERSPLMGKAVIELGRCPDCRLAEELAGARALIFPSLVEGFGLPLIEALAQGTPVIASDLPVFREVAGDVPHYVAPLDGPGWMAAVRAYAAPESPERTAQMARIARYSAPTWDSHFSAVRSFLGTV